MAHPDGANYERWRIRIHGERTCGTSPEHELGPQVVPLSPFLFWLGDSAPLLKWTKQKKLVAYSTLSGGPRGPLQVWFPLKQLLRAM